MEGVTDFQAAATPAVVDYQTDERRGRRGYLLALAFIACAVAGRAVYFTQPVNSDTAMFVFMGKLVSEGGRIGVDLIDNKLPSVGLLMSVPYKLIGGHWWGYTLLGLVMMIIAPALLARSAGRGLGKHAILPVGVAGMIWLNFPPMVYGQLQLETIQVFFVILSACAAMEMLVRYDWRDALVVGLSAGIAMWAKPTAGAILPAVVAAILFGTGWSWRDRLLSIYWIGLGVLIPTITCAWLLMITGMLEPLPQTLSQLRDYSVYSTLEWMDAIKPLIVLGALLFPVVVWGYVFRRDASSSPREGEGREGGSSESYMAAEHSRHPSPYPSLKGRGESSSPREGEGREGGSSESYMAAEHSRHPSPYPLSQGEGKKLSPYPLSQEEGKKPSPNPSLKGRGMLLFILGWLLLETVGVIAQRRMYAYHFLVMGPPAALMLGLFARRARVRSIAFAFGPAALLGAILAGRMLIEPEQNPRMTQVIGYLRQHASLGAKVWMDDYPQLMVESDLRPGSRVPLTFLFGNSDEAPLRFGRVILDDFRSNRPEWVVLDHDADNYVDFYNRYMAEMAAYPLRGENFKKAWRAIDRYVRENYVVQTQIDGVDVLKRADSVADLRE